MEKFPLAVSVLEDELHKVVDRHRSCDAKCLKLADQISALRAELEERQNELQTLEDGMDEIQKAIALISPEYAEEHF